MKGEWEDQRIEFARKFELPVDSDWDEIFEEYLHRKPFFPWNYGIKIATISTVIYFGLLLIPTLFMPVAISLPLLLLLFAWEILRPKRRIDSTIAAILMVAGFVGLEALLLLSGSILIFMAVVGLFFFAVTSLLILRVAESESEQYWWGVHHIDPLVIRAMRKRILKPGCLKYPENDPNRESAEVQ